MVLIVTCQETQQKEFVQEIKKCTDLDETCQMVTTVKDGALVTNSVEIKTTGKLEFVNNTDSLLFYFLEKSDKLFKEGHQYDIVEINGMKYVYIAVPPKGGTSRKLTISENAIKDKAYNVQIRGFCPPWVLYASPQIIVKN